MYISVQRGRKAERKKGRKKEERNKARKRDKREDEGNEGKQGGEKQDGWKKITRTGQGREERQKKSKKKPGSAERKKGREAERIKGRNKPDGPRALASHLKPSIFSHYIKLCLYQEDFFKAAVRKRRHEKIKTFYRAPTT